MTRYIFMLRAFGHPQVTVPYVLLLSKAFFKFICSNQISKVGLFISKMVFKSVQTFSSSLLHVFLIFNKLLYCFVVVILSFKSVVLKLDHDVF